MALKSFEEMEHEFPFGIFHPEKQDHLFRCSVPARNQDFMWGGANEAKVDPTTEMYFLFSDPFI